VDELTDFLSRIKSGDVPMPSDEAATKQGLVLRILMHLGWNVFDPTEVVPEYSAGPGSVDYCLRYGEDGVFIEVKRPSEDLESHQEQLLNYAFHEGVGLAILTNGQTWSFFLPRRKGSWEQRKFYTIDIPQQEPAQAATTFSDLLSKDAVTTGQAFKAADTLLTSKRRADALRDALPRAWQQMISEPDELLVDLLNERVEKLSGYKAEADAVANFLAGLAEHGRAPVVRTPMPTEKVVLPLSYTGKSIRGFVFEGRSVAAGSWKYMLLWVCTELASRHKEHFHRVLSAVRGRKRPYFAVAQTKNQLRSPERLGDTGYFVEANLNANMIVGICYRAMQQLGYNEDDLSVDAY